MVRRSIRVRLLFVSSDVVNRWIVVLCLGWKRSVLIAVLHQSTVTAVRTRTSVMYRSHLGLLRPVFLSASGWISPSADVCNGCSQFLSPCSTLGLATGGADNWACCKVVVCLDTH